MIFRTLAAILFFGAAFGFGDAARAQLGPGDLQIAHALTANSAGWAALRGAVRAALEQNEVTSQAPIDETADTMAVFLALEEGDGAIGAILAGSVRAALLASLTRDRTVMAPYASLGLTRARAEAIACLVYGKDPVERAIFADAVGLSEVERASCPQTYTGFRGYWAEAAAPLLAQPKGAGVPANVILDVGGGASASARAVLVAGQTLQAVGDFVSDGLATRSPMTIRASGCNGNTQASAATANTVLVCYELVGQIASSVERGIIAAR